MAYLTTEDKEIFREEGYIVKQGLVAPELMEIARNVIWNNLDVDRDDPSTWIAAGKEGSQGMGGLPEFHALIYDTPLFDVAEELAGKGRLAPLHGPITSANLRFPQEGEWEGPKGVHLDGNGVGGGIVNNWTVGISLYLNDVIPQGGGTCVWPETHKVMAEYFKTHSRLSLSRSFYALPIHAGEFRHVRAISNLDDEAYKEISGPAGTVMFWHSHLLHSASMNCSRDIRMAIITRFRWTNWEDLKFEDPDDMWEYWEGVEASQK